MKRSRGVAGWRQSPEISLARPGTTPDPGFESDNQEFNDYHRVVCYNDMAEGLNRTWQYIDDNGATLGYISVAAAHLRPGRDPALQGLGYGNVSALLVGYLAADKNHERQGVATDLLLWSIEEATRLSERIGCRIVMLNPLDDPKTMDFYRHLGFRYTSQRRRGRRVLHRHPGQDRGRHAPPARRRGRCAACIARPAGCGIRPGVHARAPLPRAGRGVGVWRNVRMADLQACPRPADRRAGPQRAPGACGTSRLHNIADEPRQRAIVAARPTLPRRLCELAHGRTHGRSGAAAAAACRGAGKIDLGPGQILPPQATLKPPRNADGPWAQRRAAAATTDQAKQGLR